MLPTLHVLFSSAMGLKIVNLTYFTKLPSFGRVGNTETVNLFYIWVINGWDIWFDSFDNAKPHCEAIFWPEPMWIFILRRTALWETFQNIFNEFFFLSNIPKIVLGRESKHEFSQLLLYMLESLFKYQQNYANERRVLLALICQLIY